MSLRSAFVRVKQLLSGHGGFLLPRRVLLIPGKAHPQEGAQKAKAFARHAVPRVGGETPSNRLQRVFAGRAGANDSTLAAQLRRNAALRLIQYHFRRGGAGRGSRCGGTGTHLPIYAFLGLTLAAGERGVLEESDTKKNEKMQWLPLETCCEIVRGVFQSDSPYCRDPQLPINSDFPSDTASYIISNRHLGKGTNAIIYAARQRPLPSAEGSVADGAREGEHVGEDDAIISQVDDDDEADWEMVSGETNSVDLMEISDVESLDDANDVDGDGETQEKETNDASGGHLMKEDTGDGYDLALKMMFNYDIASNATAISQAFERECLPLWSSLAKGSFGDFRWENGHRAKMKAQRFLPRHPNIVEMYHAFVTHTVAHDLDEARTLFPAALPARLHTDGMGRNQTMYLVMKRYDMTLAEYNQNIGCPSEHVAMVIIAQLLEGVAHLVHHGIAHRDLKSNNVLVELTAGSPHVVIADFGCCLADETIGLQLPYPSKHTEIGGNSALMAPEVKLAVPGRDAKIDYTKSDTWAVGPMSYEILGLPNPFYCRNGNPGLDSAQYEATDLAALPDDTHPGLAKVVSLLLRKDPAERPSATVAANMLHMLLWQLPLLTFASWEGSTPVSAIASPQQHLAAWLLRLSAGQLCQRSPRGQTVEVEGQRSWLDGIEYQLCWTFLSRVTPDEVMSAYNAIVRLCTTNYHI
ncbi:uncharacterized protein LOC110979101 [Acanthaster planci]|uniref:non-specific serine/threonine protein kinase n=1 Tax=Acanthaster planci TaxID=133434 RepID=A0A8B7YD70_ACAPL|nr:uncharacterized protein LOC110979101 [Acanthaster planci]